jgi:hypothetical protein
MCRCNIITETGIPGWREAITNQTPPGIHRRNREPGIGSVVDTLQDAGRGERRGREKKQEEKKVCPGGPIAPWRDEVMGWMGEFILATYLSFFYYLFCETRQDQDTKLQINKLHPLSFGTLSF